MNELQAMAVMIGLFVLRCVLPLLLTVTFVHLMNRFIDRWAAEEAARQDSVARPQMLITTETVPAPPVTTGPSLSCWLWRNCDETKRATCAAYRRQGISCWQARLIEEGKLPEMCPTCPRYAVPQPAA